MSTESETKSAGVPAGATHRCAVEGCGQYWSAGGRRVGPPTGHLCLIEDLRPIAEAGPAPTTAAPAEQPDDEPRCQAVTRNGHRCGREPHEETDDDHEADNAAEGGATLVWRESYLPAEQLSRKVCPHGIRWPWECKDCLYADEQPGKAADPRPAQGGMKPMPDERTQKGTGGLWRKSGIAGGKYLVQRRDGSIPEWPYFVIGAKDPAARAALMAYADEAARLGFDPQYVADIRVTADEFLNYLAEQGQGDPDARPHRKDDPAVVAKMLTGKSV